MFARSVFNVIKYVTKDGVLCLDQEDEILRSACLTAAVPH
jgi:hypothetical protein